MELQDEATWLRNRIMRIRLAFRFATEPQVESILREFIADAEDRLVGLQHRDAQTWKSGK